MVVKSTEVISMTNMDIAMAKMAITLFQKGQVDYLVPSEILELANRFETGGMSEVANLLRHLRINRWALE